MKTAEDQTGTRQHVLDTAHGIIVQKGFAATGLTEIVRAADVPKGSFYYYFDSKDDFGHALLEAYFDSYAQRLEQVLTQPGKTGVECLLDYWQRWLDTQTCGNPRGECLVVKLAAEVSDLSETMRGALQKGTDYVTARLTRAIEAARDDGSLPGVTDAATLATLLYQMWLGASLRAKIVRTQEPLNAALLASRQMLQP